jgi:hypothetical protein
MARIEGLTEGRAQTALGLPGADLSELREFHINSKLVRGHQALIYSALAHVES